MTTITQRVNQAVSWVFEMLHFDAATPLTEGPQAKDAQAKPVKPAPDAPTSDQTVVATFEGDLSVLAPTPSNYEPQTYEEDEDGAQFPDADEYAAIRSMRDSFGVGLAREALMRGVGDEPEDQEEVLDEELYGMSIRNIPTERSYD